MFGAATALVPGCGRVGYERVALECEGVFCPPHVDAGVTPGDGGRSGGDAGQGLGAAPGTDAGTNAPTPDAGNDAGAGPPAPTCGGLHALRDTFDGAPNFRWGPRASAGAEAVRANGRLELRLPGGMGAAESWYYSSAILDFRASQIAVEVQRIGGQHTRLEVREGIAIDRFNAPYHPRNSGVALAVDRGTLQALTVTGMDASVLATAPYDAAAHRFWRLREQAGTIFWETSPDRTTWTTLHRAPATFDTTHVWPRFLAEGRQANDSAAWFDDLNVGASDAPGLCGASELRDDFDESTLSWDWRPYNGGGACSVDAANGHAEVRFPNEVGLSYCALESTTPFDLEEDAITVELQGVPAHPQFRTEIRLDDQLFETNVRVTIQGGSVTMNVDRGMDDTVFGATIPYDAVAHRFWRIRESAQRTYFETSPDGRAWRVQAETDTVARVRGMGLRVAGLNPYMLEVGEQVLRIGSVNPQ